MLVNQTVTVRDMNADTLRNKGIFGATVLKVSPTGKKVVILCDLGEMAFYQGNKSPTHFCEYLGTVFKIVV